MNTLTPDITTLLNALSPEQTWLKVSRENLTPDIPFDVHFELFSRCYPAWETDPGSAVIWRPEADTEKSTALHRCMQELNCPSLQAFRALSVHGQETFWQHLLQKMKIQFQAYPEKICDLSEGTEHPRWLPKARFNITDSCFTADPDSTAIIQKNENGMSEKFSYADLEQKVSQIAASLTHAGCLPGDAIGILMPMHFIAVASFLAVIRLGCKALTIAESFSPDEIHKRLSIGNAKIILTQDSFLRDGKEIPLYAKVIAAEGPPAVVCTQKSSLKRPQDILWESFLTTDHLSQSAPATADTHSVILFSSGTTGTPKAIPWTHATPLKAACDALLHHNLTKNDVISWPTSLGWMMGPWLVFAALINQATLALYTDTPLNEKFAAFIEEAGVTVLGVIPTLVSHWRKSRCLEKVNWQGIRLFTSTGECSNPIDMLYLSGRAGYKPILEYCGGTEIGGAYLTSTLLEDNCPSVFTGPAVGSAFILMDETGKPADLGEVALIPPAIGQSLSLLNADHHAVYFEGMPKTPDNRLLRRHGDYIQRLPQGGYRMLGRSDDTMNLGGIKVSSAEIERVLSASSHILESAAVALKENTGPEKLLVYAVSDKEKDPENLKKILQAEINTHLNPLFRIDRVIVTDALPKTISGKIMRRMLRSG